MDYRELFDLARIDPNVLADREATVELQTVAGLFDHVARRIGDPAVGLSYARWFPPGGTGLLGQMVMTAPTIRDIFDALQRYLAVHLQAVQARFVEDGGLGRLEYRWPPQLATSQLHITAFYTASLVLRLRFATGPTWMPLAVDFQHRQPEAINRYRSMFGSRLNFEQSSNAVIVDITTLGKRMPTVFDGLHDSLRELSEHKIRQQSRTATFGAKLQDVLQGRLEAERPFDLEAAALDMGLQARALQWRLEQEQTSYEKVLLATRILMAERYLRETDHALSKIAIWLGFSELSAFTRWAQRRFGATPTALRQRLRDGGSLTPSTGNDAPGA